MFKFFNKSRGTIKSVRFPAYNWDLNKETKNIVRWINPEQKVALSLNFFDQEPDIPTVKNLEVLHDFYQHQISDYKEKFVCVDLVKLGEYDVIKTIFKFPQDTGGLMYLGSFTIPFKKCSYVIKIQANEVGFTGVREAVVMEKQLKKGVELDSKAYESEKYDEEFPEHPLSIVRQLLANIEANIVFTSELSEIGQFDW